MEEKRRENNGNGDYWNRRSGAAADWRGDADESVKAVSARTEYPYTVGINVFRMGELYTVLLIFLIFSCLLSLALPCAWWCCQDDDGALYPAQY